MDRNTWIVLVWFALVSSLTAKAGAEQFTLVGDIPAACPITVKTQNEQLPIGFNITPQEAVKIASEHSWVKCNSIFQQQVYSDFENYYIIKSAFGPMRKESNAVVVNGQSGAVSESTSSDSNSDKAKPPSVCSPTKLTDDDARILLYATPIAVSARKNGTDVDIKESGTFEEFPTADFLVAAIVSQRPTSNSVLGNGIMGYFAVDKRSGSVELLGDFAEVKGGELGRVQEWLRKEHCIHVEDDHVSK